MANPTWKKRKAREKICEKCFKFRTHSTSRVCGINNCSGRLQWCDLEKNRDLVRQGRTQAQQRIIEAMKKVTSRAPQSLFDHKDCTTNDDTTPSNADRTGMSDSPTLIDGSPVTNASVADPNASSVTGPNASDPRAQSDSNKSYDAGPNYSRPNHGGPLFSFVVVAGRTKSRTAALAKTERPSLEASQNKKKHASTTTTTPPPVAKRMRASSSSTSLAFGKENSNVSNVTEGLKRETESMKNTNPIEDDEDEDSVTNAYKTPNCLNDLKGFSVSTREHPTTESERDGYRDPANREETVSTREHPTTESERDGCRDPANREETVSTREHPTTESEQDGYRDTTQLHKENIHSMTVTTAWPIGPSSSISQEDTKTTGSNKNVTVARTADAFSASLNGRTMMKIKSTQTTNNGDSTWTDRQWCGSAPSSSPPIQNKNNNFERTKDPVRVWTSIQDQVRQKMEHHVTVGTPWPPISSTTTLPTGVSKHPSAKSFRVRIYVPFLKQQQYVGSWPRPDYAAQAFVYAKLLLVGAARQAEREGIERAAAAAAVSAGSQQPRPQYFGFNTVSPWTACRKRTQSKKRLLIRVEYNTQKITLGDTDTNKHTLNREDYQEKIKSLQQLWHRLFIHKGNGKYEVNRQASYQPTNEKAVEQCNAANLFLNSRNYTTALQNARRLDHSRNLKVRNTGKKLDEKTTDTQVSVTNYDHDEQVKNVRFRRKVLNLTGPKDGRYKRYDCVPFRQFDQQVKEDTIRKIPANICQYQNKTQGTTTNGVHAVLAESIDTTLNKVGNRSMVYYMGNDGILYAETTILFDCCFKVGQLFHNFSNELEFWHDHCEVIGEFRDQGKIKTLLRIIQQRYGSITGDGYIIYCLSDRSKTGINFTFLGHQLYGWTFLDGPPNWKQKLAKGPEEYAQFLKLWIVDHMNGVRHHNYAGNLRWLLESDNRKPENCGNGNFKYETRYRIDPTITKAQAKKDCIIFHPVHKEIGINNDGSVYYDHQRDKFLILTEEVRTLVTYINRTIQLNDKLHYYGVNASHFSYECHNQVVIPKDQGIVIDHKYGDRRDQSKRNLVWSNRRENAKNHKVYSNNTSGITGVSIGKNGTYIVSYRTEGTDGIIRSAIERFSCKTEAIEFRKAFEIFWGITVRTE